MKNNIYDDESRLTYVNRVIDDVITREEKKEISFSSNEKDAEKQRAYFVRNLLPASISNTVDTIQLNRMIDMRRTLETLNLSGREDIFSLDEVWIPPSVKLINLENCSNLSKICATPANVKALKLNQTAVRNFSDLSDTICELDIRHMQDRISWHTFPNRTPDNPLDVLMNMPGERALCQLPERVNVMFKNQETKGLNLYIQGWFSAPKEFIYLQEYIYTDPAVVKKSSHSRHVFQQCSANERAL